MLVTCHSVRLRNRPYKVFQIHNQKSRLRISDSAAELLGSVVILSIYPKNIYTKAVKGPRAQIIQTLEREVSRSRTSSKEAFNTFTRAYTGLSAFPTHLILSKQKNASGSAFRAHAFIMTIITMAMEACVTVLDHLTTIRTVSYRHI